MRSANVDFDDRPDTLVAARHGADLDRPVRADWGFDPDNHGHFAAGRLRRTPTIVAAVVATPRRMNVVSVAGPRAPLT